MARMARKKAARQAKPLETDPLSYRSNLSMYEKESLVAEAILARQRKAAKKNKAANNGTARRG